MLCEICKKNQANVHMVKIINGVKEEISVCDDCAKKTDGFETPFSFQSLLSGIMDYINSQSITDEASELICKNCGNSYTDFKEKGLLGCDRCYSNFSSTLTPIVKRVQGNIEHVGKIPKRAGKDLVEKRKIMTLKEELKKAIEIEEYEKAAELRDKIREMQKGE